MATSSEFQKALAGLLVMLSPMAPHFASELWQTFQAAPNRLGTSSDDLQWDKNVLEQNWPRLDDEYLLDVFFKVNNAIKGSTKVPYQQFKVMTKEIILKMALANADVVDFLGGRHILGADCTIMDWNSASLNIRIDHSQKRQVTARSTS